MELFDVVAETESESDGSATNISEASHTGSSSGHSDDSDGPRGPTKGAYVHELDESDTEVNESDPELAKTVAGRVKGTTRKRKMPSSLRAPMMIFNAVKKRRATDASPMERGSFDDKKTAMKKKTAKKINPTTVASQPPKMKRGSTSASFDDKKTEMKKKIKATRTSHLGSMKKRNVGMDYNQDMDALSPREVAAVQFISNLCTHIETSKRSLMHTQATFLFILQTIVVSALCGMLLSCQMKFKLTASSSQRIVKPIETLRQNFMIMSWSSSPYNCSIVDISIGYWW